MKRTFRRQPELAKWMADSAFRKTVCAQKRRGSLYVSVLVVSLIVSVLGMSALLSRQVQLRTHSSASDMTIARLNAIAAIRLGMQEIENDPDWRFSHQTDEWFTERPLGEGTYSLVVRDPSDNDVGDAAADPVILTGIGRCRSATHRTEVTLSPLYRGYDCLKSAIHAGDDVRFYDGQISIDHIVSANDDISANSAYVAADVETVNDISGWTFMGDTKEGADPRQVPDPDKVLEFYQTHGTTIDRDALPRQFASITRNGDFENGDTFWNAENSILMLTSNRPFTGTSAVSVSGRSDNTAGISQDIRSLLVSGRRYDVRLAVKASQPLILYAHTELEDEFGPDDHVSDPVTVPGDEQWHEVTLRIQPWFGESLSSAKLLINTSPDASWDGGMNSSGSFAESGGGALPDFQLDAITMREVGSVRNIDQQLLSPSHNPFGDVNVRGIYVLDMKGSELVIRNSRIFGTLVVLNPSSSTEIGYGGALAMSAADPRLPTLLVFGNTVRINPSQQGLSEAAMQINLNPPGAAWPGVGSDADMQDAFPSGIDGLIYSSHRLRIENVSVTGAIISDNDVSIEGNFTLFFDNRYYRNPPPGFSGPEFIRVLLGSARRVAE